MQNKQKKIVISISMEMYNSIVSEAKKEEKDISKYLQDVHISNLNAKYNNAYDCLRCGAVNQREKITCWNCGEVY